MNALTQALATQRRELDLAASRQRVAVSVPRTALSARLGHALSGAGHRLLADRQLVGRAD